MRRSIVSGIEQPHGGAQGAPMHRCAWCGRWFRRWGHVLVYLAAPEPLPTRVSDGICDPCATALFIAEGASNHPVDDTDLQRAGLQASLADSFPASPPRDFRGGASHNETWPPARAGAGDREAPGNLEERAGP